MLAHNWIVLPEFQLFGDVPGVFLSHIVKTSIGRADQFNQNCARLGHRMSSVCFTTAASSAPYTRLIRCQAWGD
jgi:hypothetical protein